ncbi:MAG: methyltransferase domain-containing protein [Cyclobacteriaceae bacterium]
MTVKDHYERHLGHFYSWMVGDFNEEQQAQEKFFKEHEITPRFSGIAVDLGCGHGLQSISLAHLGFKVRAVDFNQQLLKELKQRIGELPVEWVEAHLLEYLYSISMKPEVIVCMGDTLTHLSGIEQVEELIAVSTQKLEKGGKLVFSYRELTTELTNERRFVPVRNDDNRIHTCFLEYLPGYVKVFDVLLEKKNGEWKQQVSWYPKLRIPASQILAFFEKYNLTLVRQELVSGMTCLIAQK